MRTIIDVTQLAGWRGKLTGIPRVMYELSTRYALKPNTHLVVWDLSSKQFKEISIEDIVSRDETTDTGDASAPLNNGRELAKRVAHKIYRIAPPSIQTTARKLRAAIKTAASAPIESISGFTFQKNDALLVIWGEWGDGSYRAALKQVVGQNNIRMYQMVHDMLPLVTPQYSTHSTIPLTEYATEIYPLCTGLISISDNTKKDVTMWLNQHDITVPPITTVRLGDDFKKATPVKPSHEFFMSNKDYIVCVGTIETRKNHTLLYYTYKLAKARDIMLPPLVVVGRRGWLTENIYDLMANDPDTKDQFIFLHDASDEELAWIYEHSLFSVYPSHYEGWGLPVAESIAYGIPSISSNTSSMPEIAGDIISYFTPTSTDECLSAIKNLLDKNNLKEAKKKLGNYKTTSWDETFLQIKGIIGDSNDKK